MRPKNASSLAICDAVIEERSAKRHRLRRIEGRLWSRKVSGSVAVTLVGYPNGSSKLVKARVDQIFALAILLVDSRRFDQANCGTLVGLTAN